MIVVYIAIVLILLAAGVRYWRAQRAADRMAERIEWRRMHARLATDPVFLDQIARARDLANGETVTWNSTGEALIEVDCE